jgi:hypothetical protein
MSKNRPPCPDEPRGRHRWVPLPCAFGARVITYRCSCGETSTLYRDMPPVTVRAR